MGIIDFVLSVSVVAIIVLGTVALIDARKRDEDRRNKKK